MNAPLSLLYTTHIAAYNAYARLFPYAPYCDNMPVWDLDTFCAFIDECIAAQVFTFPLTDNNIHTAYAISMNE